MRGSGGLTLSPVDHTAKENVALDVEPQTSDGSRRLVQEIGILEREGVNSALERVDLKGGIGETGEAGQMGRDVLCGKAVKTSAR